MARISRRQISHAASASILVAALAIPAGLSIGAVGSPTLNEGHGGVSAQTTDPPPSPSDGPSDPTSSTSPPAPPSSEESDPTGRTTSPSTTPSGTSGTSEPPASGDGDSDSDGDSDETSKLPPEQKVEIDSTKKNLSEVRERVPEELVPTVDALITIIGTVEDPDTSPQDRQGVIESTEELSATLAAINDAETPPELRAELTAIVQEVTSVLEVVNDPQGDGEARSELVLVVKRTTSTLDVIRDPKTPERLRGRLIAIVKDTTFAAGRTHDVSPASSVDESQSAPQSEFGRQAIRNTLLLVSSSEDIMQDQRTPSREQEDLAEITQRVTALLKKIGDPRTSREERARATKELDEETSRMKDQQEQSASAQKRPEESLGKAAAFCTSAIFESIPESALVQGLKKLVPAPWADEGVKDFWKAEEKSSDMLDVLAQLRNNENTRGPFEVVPLISELAEVVPHDKLYGSLGGSALSCEQTAVYLEEEFGVTVGPWLTSAAGG